MEKDVCTYFVYDFNERWLKDSSLLHCIIIVLIVEGRIDYVMYVGGFLKLVSLHCKLENIVISNMQELRGKMVAKRYRVKKGLLEGYRW